jgi:hypothetical protein
VFEAFVQYCSIVAERRRRRRYPIYFFFFFFFDHSSFQFAELKVRFSRDIDAKKTRTKRSARIKTHEAYENKIRHRRRDSVVSPRRPSRESRSRRRAKLPETRFFSDKQSKGTYWHHSMSLLRGVDALVVGIANLA